MADTSTYEAGQTLKGRLNEYTLKEEIYTTVWLATYAQWIY
jgi:hypothetical protein